MSDKEKLAQFGEMVWDMICDVQNKVATDPSSCGYGQRAITFPVRQQDGKILNGEVVLFVAIGKELVDTFNAGAEVFFAVRQVQK